MAQPNDIQEILNRTDRFAANAGCRVTEVDGRHAVAEMTVTKEHLNAGGVCQGGALFTLGGSHSHQRPPQDSLRRGARHQSRRSPYLPCDRHGLPQGRTVGKLKIENCTPKGN